MKEITAAELKKQIDSDDPLIVMDCRSQESFLSEHIPGAINLRWSDIEAQVAMIVPDKNRRIVTYCSGFACDASIKCLHNLTKLGYLNVTEFPGGLAEWKSMGYPIEKQL